MIGRIVVAALLLAIACPPVDAGVARRSVRIDGFGAWDEFAIGSSSCAGTMIGSTLVELDGFTFSGRDDDAHLFDTYCQIPPSGELNSDTFTYPDEAGLRALLGDNADDAIRAVRYSFLDIFRFDSDPEPTGFQWTFYYFPYDVLLVGLYGFEATLLDDRSYINTGHTTIWDGGLDGYDGQYFCFEAGTFLGTWDGSLDAPDSMCLAKLQRVFLDGFEP
jgi:hypothetical protein